VKQVQENNIMYGAVFYKKSGKWRPQRMRQYFNGKFRRLMRLDGPYYWISSCRRCSQTILFESKDECLLHCMNKTAQDAEKLRHLAKTSTARANMLEQHLTKLNEELSKEPK